MRTNKAILNFMTNFLTILIGFIPVLLVRQVFLETLGTEMLGLSSLYGSILNLLALAELGIATAILYSLYKPFAENDRERVKGYINFYTKLYRLVGLVIFILGLVMLPFLPIFVQGEINTLDAQLYFLLFLLNSILSYLFSAKLSILIVAQEGYKLSVALAVSKLLAAVLQIALLNFYPSFYYYLVIQLAVSALYLLVMNLYVRKTYRWLFEGRGKVEKQEIKALIKNIKALFLHKIGEVMVFSTDNLIISYFISLTVVGIFNSYNMLIGALSGMIYSGLNGVTASIGNLLVTGDEKRIYEVHRKMFFFSFWLVSFTTISLWNTIRQFVLLWLGDTQYLDGFTISILLLNFYFTLMRGSVEKFKDAGGLHFQDRFAPLIEAAINLAASLVLVRYMGLPGVFIGTLISNLAIIFWVKPLVVYKYIFKKKLRSYFAMYFKYLAIGIIPLIITYAATRQLHDIITIEAFVLNCILNAAIINIVYFFIFRKTEEFLFFKKLITDRLKSREKSGGV